MLSKRYQIFIFVLLLFGGRYINAQKLIISGFVRDSVSGEILIGANLYSDNQQWGTITDEHGFFSLMINDRSETCINFSYVGYRERKISIDQLTSYGDVIYLSPDLTIPEIEIRRESNSMSESGVITINPHIINRMPSFFGERDVIRSLQYQSGVQTGKEGSTGLIVRGGSPDQNLFLVDGVPLYYFHHLGNLLSAFDPDAINSAVFFKGGFPARLGDRLSSISDIRLKDGRSDQFHGILSMGTLAMKISLEGPLSENTSLFFSLRRCNLDLLTRGLSYLDSNGKGMAGYTFYDGNIKFRQKLNRNNSLYLTLFSNRDRVFLHFWDDEENLNIERDFKDDLVWSNNFGSLRLNHQYNKQNIADFSVSYSFFRYKHSIQNQLINDGIESQFGYNSGTSVKDAIFKYDHTYYLNNLIKIRYGSEITIHNYKPFQNVSSIPENILSIGTTDLASYIETNITSGRFSSNLGLRYISVLGDNVFWLPEPRINAAYAIYHGKIEFISSYSKMHQAVHLVSDNSGGIPVDMWIPSTAALPPEVSDQFDAGLNLTGFSNASISLKLEGFIKLQQHLIELIPGNNIYNVLAFPESALENNGRSRIRGFEVEVKKKTGILSGWITYMYIKNSRQFEIINDGVPFPYLYEKPHNLSLVMMTSPKENINLSLTWQYTSGMSTNLPVAKFEVPVIYGLDNNGIGEAHIYGPRNSIRLKPYHRLDVSIDFLKEWEGKKRTFNISLINAYNRQNPFFLFYMENDQGKTTLHQLCLFPILPSLSYRLDF